MDVATKDRFGGTALDDAKRSNMPHVAEYLKRAIEVSSLKANAAAEAKKSADARAAADTRRVAEAQREAEAKKKAEAEAKAKAEADERAKREAIERAKNEFSDREARAAAADEQGRRKSVQLNAPGEEGAGAFESTRAFESVRDATDLKSSLRAQPNGPNGRAATDDSNPRPPEAMEEMPRPSTVPTGPPPAQPAPSILGNFFR